MQDGNKIHKKNDVWKFNSRCYLTGPYCVNQMADSCFHNGSITVLKRVILCVRQRLKGKRLMPSSYAATEQIELKLLRGD
jgi:hypothetical protein